MAALDDWWDRPHTHAELVERARVLQAELREQVAAIVASASAQADQHMAAFRDEMIAAQACMDQAQAARAAADLALCEAMTIAEGAQE